MLTFREWMVIEEARRKKKTLPEVKDTGFWTDRFGEGKVDDASVKDLYNHAKKHPKGLRGGIMSLQLLANYGTFPREKVREMWALYRDEREKKEEKKKGAEK